MNIPSPEVPPPAAGDPIDNSPNDLPEEAASTSETETVPPTTTDSKRAAVEKLINKFKESE